MVKFREEFALNLIKSNQKIKTNQIESPTNVKKKRKFFMKLIL